jgi:hypothetical protein
MIFANSNSQAGAGVLRNEKLLGAGMRRGFVCWIPVLPCYYYRNKHAIQKIVGISNKGTPDGSLAPDEVPVFKKH